MTRQILVTGATGFLGKHLCAQLAARGHAVTGLDSRLADLRRTGTLDRWDHNRFDYIYHLAAWTQAGDFCLYHPGEQWIINQLINANMLDWWRRSQPAAKLIAIGTSCAYAPDLPPIEENYLLGSPIESLYTYAMTKRMLFVGLQALNRQFGLQYIYAVPSTLYGPGYHTDGRQMHFIFDLIRKILAGRDKNEPVVLWGDGQQKRELIFVEDFVSALVTLAETCENEVVNLGGYEHKSIRAFANAICQIVGFDPESIQYDLTRYVGARTKYLCIDKLQRLLPTFRQTDLEVGLRRTVQWFESPDGPTPQG